MDTRTSQQTRDPSRGGHAGSAARADEGGHDRRHGSRRRSPISKPLTSMLRHGNGGASGVLSSSGWASASRLCGLRYLRNLGAEVTDLVDIVRSQDSRKRRFEMIRDDHGIVYVRAVQGHSEGSGVAVASINPEVDRDALPSFLLHCTFRRHLDSILNNGLLAGGDRGEAHRLQVHYVDGFPGVGDVGRGIRPGAEIGVIIDPREYADAGGRFQVTPQEVAGGAFRCYLSGSVPPRFITLIRDIRSREILYSREDERTAEAKAASPLPASVPKAKMSSAAKPAAKPKSRGQSPEPTDAQLSIPYFAECYQIQKDNHHKEKWTAGRLCRDTELAMDVNKDEERKYYLRLCKHYGVEPISEDSAYFRRHAARLGKPKVAGSSAAASFLQAGSNESAAGAASASAPSKTREEKKSEESQGSSLGPPGPPPGPPPEKSSVRKSTRAESAPARRTTGAEFLSEGRKEKRPVSADKGAKSGSADTGRIARTSGSSSADAGGVAGASSTSATVKSESQSAVARLRECLSEAASSGKLAKVLSENPKEAKEEDPTSEVKVEDPAFVCQARECSRGAF